MEIGAGACGLRHEEVLTDCGKRCLGKEIGVRAWLVPWGDDPIKEV